LAWGRGGKGFEGLRKTLTEGVTTRRGRVEHERVRTTRERNLHLRGFRKGRDLKGCLPVFIGG